MTFRPMKPETKLRRAAERVAERKQSREQLLHRIAEAALRHEREGDMKSAAFYADIFVDTLAAHEASSYTGAE